MHARGDDHSPACLDGRRFAAEGGDRDQVASVPRKGFAKLPPPEPSAHVWEPLELLQILLEVGITVGIAMREVHHVAIVLESHCEGQCVVIGAAFVLPSDPVLVINDVLAIAHPADAMHLRLDVGILQGPHAFIVHGGWLHHIDDVEAVLRPLTRVPHSEEVPLGVRLRIVIRVQHQIVLEFVNLYSPAQIATLEAALEDKRGVRRARRRVVRWQLLDRGTRHIAAWRCRRWSADA
mmetsp:Transcript_108559/g.306029  ORF Transcript_108559/g.306029 Transcript_108559/m.306029 type:complete len:236 (-) Transcript_108559:1122-1829(-)